jgi:hypothetical protein
LAIRDTRRVVTGERRSLTFLKFLIGIFVPNLGRDMFRTRRIAEEVSGWGASRRWVKQVLELFPECPVSFMGRMEGTIAMRIKVLAAIATVALAAGTGLAVHPGSLPLEKQSTPAAAQLALAQSVDPFLLRSGG